MEFGPACISFVINAAALSVPFALLWWRQRGIGHRLTALEALERRAAARHVEVALRVGEMQRQIAADHEAAFPSPPPPPPVHH